MRKCWLAMLVFGLIVLTGIGTVQAAVLGITWRPDKLKGVFRVTDPQRYQQNVFNFAILPPAIGGNQGTIDVVDRVASQLAHLQADLHDNPAEGKRYVLFFNSSTWWIYQQLQNRGFITIRWSDIRNCFWDRQLNRSLKSTEWRYSDAGSRLDDDCKMNCDYSACEIIELHWSHITSWCDCEEYQGRTFCHKKNFFTYSDFPDQ